MRYFSESRAIALLVVVAGLAGCATTGSPVEAASGTIRDDLSCTLPTNCVTTVGEHAMPPLRFNGTVADGLAQLRATLSSFPAAVITRTQDNFVEAVFTTAAGFKDTVLFRANAAEKKIDFRSHSNFGFIDFGKNSARMRDFATRFEQLQRAGAEKK